jgi:hypothetical protein
MDAWLAGNARIILGIWSGTFVLPSAGTWHYLLLEITVEIKVLQKKKRSKANDPLYSYRGNGAKHQ